MQSLALSSGSIAAKTNKVQAKRAVVARASAIKEAASKDINVKVLTPEAEFMSGIASEVILPSSTGQIGILPFHAPLISSLDVGIMLYKNKESGDWQPFALMGGFALVQNNNVTILVNGAESTETIDVDEVKKDFEAAKAKYEKSLNGSATERVEANLELKRARALVQLSD